MWIAKDWKDYELLDCGGGEKLERWDQADTGAPRPAGYLGDRTRLAAAWRSANGRYTRCSTGGGHWDKGKLPESWQVHYKDLTFQVKPMNFKHTGLFPEQAVNWDFAMEQDPQRRAAHPGAESVCLHRRRHGGLRRGGRVGVPCGRQPRAWWPGRKENARLSGLAEAPIRWIVDDCAKFVEREIRRGKPYDAIIMDPPSYGRGPGGEVWKLEEQPVPLRGAVLPGVLSDKPLFVHPQQLHHRPCAVGAGVHTAHAGVGEKFGGHGHVG